MASSNLPARLASTGWTVKPYDPEATMRASARSAYILFGVLATLFVLLMVLIPIGGAVVASGQVGIESRIKRIAHPTGGTIAEIYVTNGDHVEQGQPLMRFDDNVSGTDSQLSSLTVSQLLAQHARLDAERLGQSSIAFPAQLVANPDAGAKAAMTYEQKMFNTRRSEAGGLRAQLAARSIQYERQIAGYQAQIDALRKQQVLIGPELKGVKELWDKDLVTISRLNQLERNAVDMDGSIASLQAQIAQTQARITETSEQMIQLDETRRAEAGTQLATINNTLNEQQMRSVTAGDVQRRSVIRAPYSGVVDKMAFTSIGDVIRPAETIMEIVPDHDRLLLEVMLSPNDIDQIKVGQRARIRFTAFNSTATPEVSGKLIYVAPDRTNNPDTKQSYYAARVSVDGDDLKRHPELVLKAGMPAEVFIESSNRSMLSYITKPLRDQLSRAFKDN